MERLRSTRWSTSLVLAAVAVSAVAIAFLIGCSRGGGARETLTPTPEAQASDTPAATAAPSATATATRAAVTPSPSATPTSTPSPTPTSAPTAVPTPSPTPAPAFDDRYALIASGDVGWQLNELGASWYLDFTSDPRTAPPGTKKVPLVSVKPGRERLSAQTITEYAQGAPGSVWYIGGEVNVPAQDGISPQDYVAEFDYYYNAIKAADPTAKIGGPSVLNWDFTCTGCGGYTTGRTWMREFVAEYAAAHQGATPPIDIWLIDAYPLTWDKVPMTDWVTVVQQVQGYRQWLDTEVPGQASKPIWITEMASHWAFSAWRFDAAAGGLTIPEGQDWVEDYLWEDMETYLTSLFDWLEANAEDLNIGRWFLYTTYVDISQTAPFNGYAGIYLFDGPHTGASMNRLGELFRRYATNSQ